VSARKATQPLDVLTCKITGQHVRTVTVKHNVRTRSQKRPPGDLEYCMRTRNRSPRETRWEFHDSTV